MHLGRFVWIGGLAGQLLLVGAFNASAQQSASFRLTEFVLNSGGNPAGGASPTSTTFRLSLDSLGDSLIQPGLASPSFRFDAGFSSTLPPPGEVQVLRFSDDTTLVWDPEKSVGNYAVYRGSVETLPGPYGACLSSALPTATAIDAANPKPGATWFYLVTARNRLGEEGTKGFDSDGVERGNPSPCP